MTRVADVARTQYRHQQTLNRRAVDAATAWWAELTLADLDGSWAKIGPHLLTAVGAAQTIAAGLADPYLTAALQAQGIDPKAAGDIDPYAFSGVASDGRPLDTLLYEPVIRVKALIAGGTPSDEAQLSGLASLVRIVNTQVADAGRTAIGAGRVARPQVTGYIRVLSPPSCSRCAILAGRWYRWNADFNRHVNCDCTEMPGGSENAVADLIQDPNAAFRAGQITDLSKADTQALHDGADIGRLVNAHRGMYSASGRQLTTELRTGRHAGIRLMPEQIYRDATSREDAVRLLRRFGYIV